MMWRAIPGWPDYEASDLGEIRSLDRRVPYGDKSTRFAKGRVMAQQLGTEGRPSVMVYGPDGSKRIAVYRLVLLAFVGAPDSPDLVACHNDGDPTNNRLCNLRWDTASANQADSLRHGTQYNANKTHCANGHPFSPENTYQHQRPNGRLVRHCRACNRARSSKARAS